MFSATGAGPVAAKNDPGKHAQNVYFQALQALESGSFLKGVQLYYRFLLIGDLPLSKEVRAHDLVKAMGQFKKELADKTRGDKAALAIILIDRIIERLDKADKRLNALREKFPSSVLLAFIKGELMLALGDQNLAVRIFGTMSRLPSPRGFPALADYLLERRGQGKRSDPAARRNFLMRIAYRRWDETDFAGAKKIFRNIMSEFPKDPEAPRALVDLLIQIDKADEAVQLIDEWQGSSTEQLIAPLPLARIRYSQGRFAEVIELLTPLQKADPQDMYLRLLLAESRFQTGQYAAAAPLYESLSEADRKNQGFLQRWIACLDASGNITEGVSRLEAYIQENPNDSAMRVELASILMRLEKYDDARAQYYALKEVGNPYRGLALQQIAVIDKVNYDRLFNAGTANPDGVASPASAPEAGSAFPDPTSIDQKPKQAEDVENIQKEQIERMKELFK